MSRRRKWHPTPVLLPGKSHEWRSLVGCSPWSHKESDTTERLHFDFSLSCIGEGNGNPLRYSCLENPRDGGAWWAAVYGVIQSRTRLKRLSSCSKACLFILFMGSFSSKITNRTRMSTLATFIQHCLESLQFSSVTQSCLTLCNPMNCSMPGLPVHHQLPEFTQTHMHQVSNAIQPSHPLSSPSLPAPNPSQHQGLFQ